MVQQVICFWVALYICLDVVSRSVVFQEADNNGDLIFWFALAQESDESHNFLFWFFPTMLAVVLLTLAV